MKPEKTPPQQITCETDQSGIMIITLKRPQAMNAFTARMMHELIAVFDEADANDKIRAIIVTGDGTRAFCAGADLASGENTFNYAARKDEARRPNPLRPDGTIDWSADEIRDGGGRLTLRIFDCTKPVIAAVNGAAVGVGATMQLPMDIRIAADTARYGFVFARRGIIPEACSSWFLPRLVGIQQALDWCYSGRLLNADEAHAAGLVHKVVPQSELMAFTHQYVTEMIKHSAPISVTLTRQMMWRMLGADHPMQAHKIDSKAIFGLGRLPDAKEGVVSFLEKRPPQFTGSPANDIPDFYPWWKTQEYS